MDDDKFYISMVCTQCGFGYEFSARTFSSTTFHSIGTCGVHSVLSPCYLLLILIGLPGLRQRLKWSFPRKDFHIVFHSEEHDDHWSTWALRVDLLYWVCDHYCFYYYWNWSAMMTRYEPMKVSNCLRMNCSWLRGNVGTSGVVVGLLWGGNY